MDLLTGMNRALDYIEAHMTEPLKTEDIARQAYLSPYYFHRLFGVICGCTLGEYIRRRRLTLAAVELSVHKMKVIDAAYQYGYESPDSFCKAFTKFHGVTPSAAREPGAKLKMFTPLTVKITKKGGSTMNYRIEQRESSVLIGYKRRFSGVPGERAEQEEAFFVQTREEQALLHNLANDLDTQMAVITHVDEEGYDFYIAAEPAAPSYSPLGKGELLNAQVDEPFERLVIPAKTYAVFETPKNRYPTLFHLSLRHQIFTEWFPLSGYTLADAPEMIVYHWYGAPNKENRYIELYIPVEKS